MHQQVPQLRQGSLNDIRVVSSMVLTYRKQARNGLHDILVHFKLQMLAGDMTPRQDPRQESSSVPALQEQRLEANSFAYVAKINVRVPHVNGKFFPCSAGKASAGQDFPGR
jgi:hypothetical protein